MIADEMVTSIRDSTEADFQDECCIPYQDYVINQSILSEDEKQICNLKLSRFDYEKKQANSLIQDTAEEDNLLNACSDVNPSTTNTDRKYINDFVSSHFHDLLTPMQLSLSPSQTITPVSSRSIYPSYPSGDTGDENEWDNVTGSFIHVLSNIIQKNESIFDKPVPFNQLPSKYNTKIGNSTPFNQMSTFYNKAKEVDRTQNRLPYKLNLMENDSTSTLPHRRRESSSSSTISTFSISSRTSSISADISQIQGELYSVLSNVGRLEDGVNRINEIKNRGSEITEAQKTNRQFRDELTTVVSPNIWKSVYNIFDEEKKQIEDTYDPMISMRMSYCPASSLPNLDELEVKEGDRMEGGFASVDSTFIHDREGMTPYLQSTASLPSDIPLISSQSQLPLSSSQPIQSQLPLSSSQPIQSQLPLSSSSLSQIPPALSSSQSQLPLSSSQPIQSSVSSSTSTLPSKQPPAVNPPPSTLPVIKPPPTTSPVIKPPPTTSPYARASRTPSEVLIIEQPRLREGARLQPKNDASTPVLAIPHIQSLQQHKGRMSQTRSSLQPPSPVHPSFQATSNRETINSNLPVQSTPSLNSDNSGKPTIVIPLPKRRFSPRKPDQPSNTSPITERHASCSLSDIPSPSSLPTNRTVFSDMPADESPIDLTLSNKQSELESVNSNSGISTSYRGSILSASAALSREDVIREDVSSEVIKKLQPESSQSDTSRVSLMVNDMAEQAEQEEQDASESDLDREVGVAKKPCDMSTEEILAESVTEDMLNEIDNEIIL